MLELQISSHCVRLSPRKPSCVRHIPGPIISFAGILFLVVSPVVANESGIAATLFDNPDGQRHQGVCSITAEAAHRACRNEVRDDYWIAVGNCLNSVSSETCIHEAKSYRFEAWELCRDQRDARFDLCDLIGETAYDPRWSPEEFVDPLEIGTAVEPNPYFPLIPGTTWVYRSNGRGDDGQMAAETVTVSIKQEVNVIGGVRCVVVNDVVERNGVVIEDTNDWYAQDKNSNVWYCGEIARKFEYGHAGSSGEPELVDLEGSWKAFRSGAKPGIIMFGTPVTGAVYRQETALGHAEDAAEIVGIGESELVPYTACDKNCVVTRDFTPIEPGTGAHKYYAPKIGLILEIDVESGDRVELVDMYLN